jgi:hypothetical protein
LSDQSFAAPETAVKIRNFTFHGGMLPGWVFARAREIDTGRDVRLVQVNAQAEASDGMVRIEVLETAGPEEGRTVFCETLTRFQRDPASILRIPPEIGEAEASVGSGTVVFLRGNLVVTVTSMMAKGLAVEDLANALDDWIQAKPEVRAGDADVTKGKPMIKAFSPADGGAGESYVLGRDGSARRLAEDDDNP